MIFQGCQRRALVLFAASRPGRKKTLFIIAPGKLKVYTELVLEFHEPWNKPAEGALGDVAR